MTREEHTERINEIIKRNRQIKSYIETQNNKLSQIRDYVPDDVPEDATKAYQCGLDDAWECARKIALSVEDGGISAKALRDAFNVNTCYSVFRRYSAQEAIKKIEEYERQKDAIKIGDEVCYTDATIAGVVVRCRNDGFYNVMDKTGQQNIRSGIEITRTGRTFPQVEEMFRAMQEGEDNEDRRSMY